MRREKAWKSKSQEIVVGNKSSGELIHEIFIGKRRRKFSRMQDCNVLLLVLFRTHCLSVWCPLYGIIASHNLRPLQILLALPTN